MLLHLPFYQFKLPCKQRNIHIAISQLFYPCEREFIEMKVKCNITSLSIVLAVLNNPSDFKSISETPL